MDYCDAFAIGGQPDGPMLLNLMQSQADGTATIKGKLLLTDDGAQQLIDLLQKALDMRDRA